MVDNKSIDRYIENLFVPPDPALSAALKDSENAGLPEIHISPNQGRLLYLLARIAGARRILEIGLLGGYSTIWLARALPADGQMISLELEEKHARVALKNIERAGLQARVSVRMGSATAIMDQMIRANEAPFDLIFIDADKTGYSDYLQRSMQLVHSGSVIIADNVIRDGKVLKPDGGGDEDARAIQKFNRELAADTRLEGILLPIIREIMDGMAIARVR